MTRSKASRWLCLLFYLGVLTVNALSVFLPLGGNSTKEISDMYYTLITPAGYAFSIWSVIYFFVGGFILYQFLNYAISRELLRAIQFPFILSCIFNMSWLILWHYLYIELSLAAMLCLLVTLAVIYRNIVIAPALTTGQRWLIRLPFTLYLSWICVAFIVNVSIVLEKNEWSGLGLPDTAWAVIMLCVGALLAVVASYPYRNYVFSLVFVWAYTAIAVEHKDNIYVLLTSLAAAVLLLFYSIWLFLAPRMKSKR